MHLPHLERACMMLGYGLGRKTRAVIQAPKGLARAGGRIRGTKPAVSESFFVKISSRNSLSDAFVQAVWASWLFLLRVLSDCLILKKRSPGERMDPDSVLASPAVIGLERGAPVIKLHRRKHMAGGSRMIRRCICDKYPE